MTEDTMPKRTVDVQPGEYVAYVREIDYASSTLKVKDEYWVSPTRVYRGGVGRQSIQFERDGKVQQLECFPGAGSFELYKRVR